MNYHDSVIIVEKKRKTMINNVYAQLNNIILMSICTYLLNK